MTRAALLSVSDKTGIVEFARGLRELGFLLLSTSGTLDALRGAGIEVISVEEYTGQAEILGGRVKTLHPKIHAGILAKRSDDEHMAQLKQSSIHPIDVVAVNLYPFLQHIHGEAAKDAKRMIELVDVGGPTMLRAAAKNFASVYSVLEPADYNSVIEAIATKHAQQECELRRKLASKVFIKLAEDNLEVAKYFGDCVVDEAGALCAPEQRERFGLYQGVVLEKFQDLRYGENPHQSAAFYASAGHGVLPWKQLQGKELSYNNLLDFDAAQKTICALGDNAPAAVIIKHLNPCGAAYGQDLTGAVQRAKQGDPRSHFGGIIAVNKQLDEAAAQEIAKDFVEIVLAPSFHPKALAVLESKKNIRVIETGELPCHGVQVRSAASGILMQEEDKNISPVEKLDLVTGSEPQGQLLQDLNLAWVLCARVSSNAITLVKDGMLLAAGGGQMSCIDSTQLAIMKAKEHGHETQGAVAASDAFFPFPDSVEALIKAGVQAIVVPAGAKRDDEIIGIAQEARITLLMANERHFRH